jgi:hypothetical protein
MREPRRPPERERFAATCLAFLERTQLPAGRFHNRLSVRRRWLDEVGADKTVESTLWALGVVSASATTGEQRERADALFAAGAEFRTPSPRANAAMLGGDPSGRRGSCSRRRLPGSTGSSPDPDWP